MRKKLIVVFIIVIAVAVYFLFDLDQYLNFSYLKAEQARFQEYYLNHRLVTIVVYAMIYIVVTALSIPGATVMSLAGGAILGFWMGTVVISFSSTIGATLAFIGSRYLFRDFLQEKLKDKLKTINEGVKREGALYLLTMRLVPMLPFFFINAAFAQTYIKVTAFYWVSQLGMLPGTAVYVNAGTQLSKLESLSGILSPNILIAFSLLAIVPLVSKKTIDFLKARKALRTFTKPKNFDYNVVVLGAGSGGLVSAYIAATVKARVALVEKDKMGGDCLNTGCVPSKALIRSAKMLHYAKRATDWGFKSMKVNFDFADIMERVQDVIKQIEPHDSVEQYTELGVDVFTGNPRILDPYRIQINGQEISTRTIIIATGGKPFVPPIPGIEKVSPLTSETLWEIRELPRRLVVVGGGPIGCEMTQTFARFGSQVTQVETTDCLLTREDPEVSDFICQVFKEEGIKVLTNHRVTRFEVEKKNKIVICDFNGKEVRLECDEVLLGLGRKANVTGFGLEELGVELRDNGTIETDRFLRTNFPNIYAVGDVTGPFQFTHFASFQAWYATVNSLFSPFKKFKVDYRIIPWTTFTDPEVARVGLNEQEAINKNIPFEVIRYDFKELDRAITDGEDRGFVKVITPPGKDKILGVSIVGPHAGDILSEFVLAMKNNMGLNKILGTIHVYPTLGEATKAAAGSWKKAHAPETALKWLKKFHSWRR